MATHLKAHLLDAMFNATAYSETQLYLSLHTADPGATGANEVTGGSYARQTIPKVASSGGTYTSNANIDFAGMPACTVTHVGVWDALTGNFLYSAAVTSKAVNAGDAYRIASGSLTATFS
jgi:hypothetical protein